jgi:hypothetical protein
VSFPGVITLLRGPVCVQSSSSGQTWSNAAIAAAAPDPSCPLLSLCCCSLQCVF